MSCQRHERMRAEIAEKEKAYAKHLGKDAAELTAEEKLAAADYKPAEKTETKKVKSSTSKSEDTKNKPIKDGEGG